MDDIKAEIRRMVEEGKLTRSQMGAALGVTKNTVQGHINRMGLADPASSPIKKGSLYQVARKYERATSDEVRRARKRAYNMAYQKKYYAERRHEIAEKRRKNLAPKAPKRPVFDAVTVEEFIRLNGVTKCPPAYCARVEGGEPLGPVPSYDRYDAWVEKGQRGNEAQRKRRQNIMAAAVGAQAEKDAA